MCSVTVKLRRGVEVTRKDTFSESDGYVVIEALAGGAVLASATSAVVRNTREPVWDSDHCLSGDTVWDPRATVIKFTLWDKDPIGSEYIGEAEISIADFIETPEPELLLHDGDGNPVLGSQAPYWPCALHVSLDITSLPSSWPTPSEEPSPQPCPRHVFMLTRGTRGDVQPFVALARGMAKQRGWLVTICTELRWKSFVLSNAEDAAPGRICFADSGGDTEKRVNSALGQWATKQKSEFMQLMMLANSEAEFFNSSTVIMRRLKDLEMSSTPVDMLVYGFTLTSIGLMAGEYFKLPAVGFFLQPSSIPSIDPNWTAVQAINTHGLLTIIDSFEERAFTSQASLSFFKAFAEKNPFARFNINRIRSWYDLPPVDTYTQMKERRSPVVIPMQPDTFDRPSDWWDQIITTDFIFLRKGGQGGNALGEPLDGFIKAARAAGAKLALMTFSSMPVARGAMLRCAVKMVKECPFNLRLIYVGKRQEDFVPEGLLAEAKALEEECRFLDTDKADFGVLFPFMDVFIVHGGLGTTVEALRMNKPTCVTGPLLMDQRFWGKVCHKKCVGTPPVHVDNFEEECLKFVNGALDPSDPEGWQAKARQQDWGDVTDDGVQANVDCFAELLGIHEAPKNESAFACGPGADAGPGLSPPAKRRRRGGAALPRAVERALANEAVVREVGGLRVLGLGGPLRAPEPEEPIPGQSLEEAAFAALLRSPHSLQAEEQDLPELVAREEVLPRALARSAPRRPYRRRQNELKTVIHWGQRKLLLSEIEFLTMHGSDCSRVIYAGAAPGVHIPFLTLLFPHLRFILVDPGEFKIPAREGLELKRAFFTAELARELREEASGPSSRTLFISDVRTADCKIHAEAEVEERVAEDMARQQEWVRILRPRMAMLKFRLPYHNGRTTGKVYETEYLDGTIHLPIWGPPTTTEARLITDGTASRLYDDVEYEEQMFYFNTVTRVKRYHTPMVGAGLCESYDSAAEMKILEAYLASLAPAFAARLGELLGPGPPASFRGPGPGGGLLAPLFGRLGREASARGRHLLTILPADTRERWFRAKVFDAATGQYLDACSEEGQELLCLQRSSGQEALELRSAKGTEQTADEPLPARPASVPTAQPAAPARSRLTFPSCPWRRERSKP